MPLESGVTVDAAVCSALQSLKGDSFHIVKLSADISSLVLAQSGKWWPTSAQPLREVVEFLKTQKSEAAYVVLGGSGKRFPLMVLHIADICSTRTKMAYSASKPPLRKIIGSCTEVNRRIPRSTNTSKSVAVAHQLAERLDATKHPESTN
jgi:hypothetical protein